MKRKIAYIGIILLAGLVASCGKDKNIEQTADTANTVTLGAGVNNGTSRAGSVIIPDGYELRYILEVWSTGNSPTILQRHEQLSATADNVNFSFKLDSKGDYKALLWADFVPRNTQPQRSSTSNGIAFDHYTDLHYTTGTLTSVSLEPTYTVNDPTRDAFSGSVVIKKEVGAYNGDVTLVRPFGQLTLVEKNTTLAGTMKSAALTYSVPDNFNVETGAVTGTKTVTVSVGTPAAGSGILLTDYILAPASPDQTILGEIAMTFEGLDETTHLLDPFTIPANIPVARNRRTNVTGSMLHQSDTPSDDANLVITLSGAWENATTDMEKDIDLHVPDAAFRAFCIRNGYADTEGYIIKEKAATVTTLNVPSMNITSLKGSEHFINLTNLSCFNNKITTLDLALYPKLTQLYCDHNQITTLDVTKCAGLTHLYCYSNQITTLDVTGCTQLRELNCYDNQIATLDVRQCTGLTILKCHKNFLETLDLTRCTELTSLACLGNQLKTLDLTACTKLTYVDCHDNQITTLDVTNCTVLEELNCYSNHITTLDVTGCTALTNLSCYSNRLSTLDASNMNTPWILECGGQTTDGTTAQQLTLTLRADQQERWEQQASSNNNKQVSPNYK